MNKIDINKPLEAVHTETGRVVPMKYSKRSASVEGRFYTTEAPCGASSNECWNLDGSDVCHYKAWTIRNVGEVEAPKVDWLSVDKSKPLETIDGHAVSFVHPGMVRRDDGEAIQISRSWSAVNVYVNAGIPSWGWAGYEPFLRNVTEASTPTASALDLTKPLQTRDGRPVVLITSEGRGKYPVLGYVGDDTGPTAWTAEGKYLAHTSAKDEDLVNVEDKPVETAKFGYVYFKGPSQRRNAIDVYDEPRRIGLASADACVKFTLTDGKVTAAELL